MDLPLIRRALHSNDEPVLLGRAGGFQLQWVATEERADLWTLVRDRYAGPGGDFRAGEYMGDEFAHQDGRRLVYLEVWC